MNHLVRQELDLEQYQCRECRRFFYIFAMERSGLDFDFGCPYGCDDNGELTRVIYTKVVKVEEK